MRCLTSTSALRPFKYELRFVILALQHPRCLLIETIHYGANDLLEERPAASNGGRRRELRLHAAAQSLRIEHISGGTLASPAPESNVGVAPEKQDVATIHIDDDDDTSNGGSAGVINLVIDVAVNETEMRGLYTSKFTAPAGDGTDAAAASSAPVTKHMWATHFEPIAARHCFACVDECNARADVKVDVFVAKAGEFAGLLSVLTGGPLVAAVDAPTLSAALMVPPTSSSSGGAPVASDAAVDTAVARWIAKHSAAAGLTAAESSSPTAPNAYKHYNFAPMHAIPPYLCALAVGEFDSVAPSAAAPYVSKLSGREVPLRFYYPRGRDVKTAHFALDVLRFSIEFFEGYFGIAYPYAKLEQACVVSFAIGGMENAGLVLLTERVMLDPAATAVARKKGVTDLCAHEVSHMWFGDLVGLSSWSGLWLKEGFASFFGAFATHAKEPTWGAFDGMSELMFDALAVAGHADTHAIELPITDPSLITQMFDALSYNAGLSCVKMLYHFLGPETFRRAISEYVGRYANKNTTTAQLWQSLEDSTGAPIAKMMNCFTTHMGYPVVRVAVAPLTAVDVAASTARLMLSQAPFRLVAPATASAEPMAGEPIMWTIPVTVIPVSPGSSANANANANATPAAPLQHILAARSDEIAVPLPRHDSGAPAAASAAASVAQLCVMVNEDHNGFYRVEYDSPLFAALLLTDNYARLSESFRTGLVDDTLALYAAGSDPRNLLELLAVVAERESSPLVMMHAAGAVPGFFALHADAVAKTGTPAQWASLFERCFGGFARLAASLGVATVADESPVQQQLRPLCWSAVVRAFEWMSKRRQSQSQATATSNGTSNGTTTSPQTALEAQIASLMATLRAAAVGIAQQVIARTADGDMAGVVIDSDMLLVLLRSAVRFGGDAVSAETIFDGLWAYFVKHPDALVSRDILLAVCATTDAGRYKMVADEAFSGSIIRTQMGHSLCAQLAANSTLGGADLWPHFQRHIETIIARWGSGQFRIQAMVEKIGEVVDSSDEYAGFFAAHPIPNANLSMRRATQDIQVRAALRASVASVMRYL